MKFISLCLSFLLLAHTYGFSQNSDWKIRLETYSSSEMERAKNYEVLKEIAPEFHKTIIRLDQLPESEIYLLNWKRPLFKGQLNACEVSRETLLKTQETFKENALCHVIVSQGFLPGEKIEVWVETKDGQSKSSIMTVIPQPVIATSTSDKVTLSAELTKEFSYEFFLKGLKDNEEVTYISESLGEILEKTIPYTKGMGIHVAPAVKGSNSGFVTFSIIRANKDRVSLRLPWGMELQNHLIGERHPVVHSFNSIKQ